MNRARARTSSTSPVLRLLFVGVACLILNLWVALKRHGRCDSHRRGTRQHHRRLTILRLCHFLIRAIERRLRTVEAIRPPGSVHRWSRVQALEAQDKNGRLPSTETTQWAERTIEWN